eukprot:Hpha_TRINITY_DN13392_c0_g1::TRINITY_DN13392_c0_g1_i2::g.95491::m.95491
MTSKTKEGQCATKGDSNCIGGGKGLFRMGGGIRPNKVWDTPHYLQSLTLTWQGAVLGIAKPCKTVVGVPNNMRKGGLARPFRAAVVFPKNGVRGILIFYVMCWERSVPSSSTRGTTHVVLNPAPSSATLPCPSGTTSAKVKVRAVTVLTYSETPLCGGLAL